MTALLVGLLGLAAIVVQFAGAATACSTETTACALRHDERAVWRGQILRDDGRPAGRQLELSGSFPARGAHPVRLRTDRLGRYCVYAAEETENPGLTPLTTGYRRVDLEVPTEAAVAIRPPGCSEVGGVAWHRVRDVTSTWQFAVLLAACAVPFVGLWISLFLSGRRRTRVVHVTLAASVVVLVASLAAWSW